MNKLLRQLWFGGCKWCGHWTSQFGLSLMVTVKDYKRGKPWRPLYAQCVECEKIHHPLGYASNMDAVFARVDRVPHVPTQREADWWRYWGIDGRCRAPIS